MGNLASIPTPLSQRWREFKIKVMPVIVFVATLIFSVHLWQEHVTPATMTGEVESVQTEVISPYAGVVSNLWVSRFQTVRAGDPIAEIHLRDTDIIRSQTDLAQLQLDPILDQQRNYFDYHRLRLGYLQEKSELASARITLQRAHSELKRHAQLHEEGLISDDQYDETLRRTEALQAQVEQKDVLVQEMADALVELKTLTPYDSADPQESDAPPRLPDSFDQGPLLREMGGGRMVLRAPQDGTVSSVLRRNGENVVAGESLVTIEAPEPERIVGYLRQPISVQPEPGMPVKVRLRSSDRQEAWARIERVASQYQPISTNLLRPGLDVELGLAVSVTLPPDLPLRPGELVDLVIQEER